MARAARSEEPDLARFRQELEVQKRSRYTIKHYGLVVRQFQAWMEEQRGRPVPLRAATPGDLKQYQIFLTTQRNYRKNTLYISVKALQAFYRFLGLDVADELKPPRRSQSLPKYLTEAEASQLRAAAASARARAAITLLLYGGLRVGELCRLTLEGIDFQEKTVRILSGKGDKDRLIVVSQRCLDEVQDWLKEQPPAGSDYVFPGRSRAGCMTERAAQRMVRTTRARPGSRRS